MADNILTQQYFVMDFEINELRDTDLAKKLTTRSGVYLQADIKYHEMPYFRRYRTTLIGESGTMWEFSNQPFSKEASNG